MQKQKTMRYQTSDYLDFDTATALVRKLYREEKYALSLLIGCGIFFGLRISDILSLRWEQLLNEDDKFVIYEKKTKKRRTIKINAQFKPHILACYEAIHPMSLDRPCFISQKHGVYSVQRINVLLKRHHEEVQPQDRALLHSFAPQDLWQEDLRARIIPGTG